MSQNTHGAIVIKTRNRHYVQLRNGWEPNTSNRWAILYAKMIEQEHIPDNSDYPLTERTIAHWQSTMKSPIEVINTKGWNTDHITSEKTVSGYKLTLRYRETIGTYTVNLYTRCLFPEYRVTRSKIRHTPLPTIIVCDIDTSIKNSKVIKHWITLWIEKTNTSEQ